MRRNRPHHGALEVCIAVGSHHEKIKMLTDWEPRFTFEEGLAQTIDFFRDNLEKYKVDIYNI